MTFSPSIVGTGLTGYNYLARTQDAQLAAFARSPGPARDVAQFQQRIAGVETADQLLDDRTLLRVALGAFGLDEDIDNRAFLRDVLTSDLNDPRSTANRLNDKRYQQLARTFNFSGSGSAVLPGTSRADAIATDLRRLDGVADLFANPNLLNRTLEAFDLQAFANQPIVLEQALLSDLSDRTALAYRLGDPNIVDLARAFQGGESFMSASLLSRVSDSVAARLQRVETADELMADPRLLDSVLAVYGLEDEAGNTFLLREVMDSDPNDPAAFANRLSDPRFAQMATDLGFAARAADAGSIYAYAELLESRLGTLGSSDDLLADVELRDATLAIFGLSDVAPELLKDVLDSDLDDANSVANRQDDLRLRALADAFGFGELIKDPDSTFAQRQLSDLVEAVGARTAPARDVAAFTGDLGLMLAAYNFFDIPQADRGLGYAARVLTAYGDDPTAPFLPRSDARYKALFDALNFRPAVSDRVYPPGFAEAVTERYLERQFEIAVGEIDPSQRLALSLERELGAVVDAVSSNDARWFTLMGTPQLRTVFEGAFGLPRSFGALDVNRQLSDLQTRSERQFGTSDLSELLAPDRIAEVRRSYLMSVVSSGATGPTAPGGTGSAGASLVNLLL